MSKTENLEYYRNRLKMIVGWWKAGTITFDELLVHVRSLADQWDLEFGERPKFKTGPWKELP